MRHVEHTVTVQAPREVIWQILVDVEGYADIFPPTEKVEIVEEGPGHQTVRLHVDVNGETVTWTSRRDLDAERHVIAYRQLETAPIVGGMSGEWRAFVLDATRTQLVLTHDFTVREPADDGLVAGRFTADEASALLEAAVERNSVADLGAVLTEAERRTARGGERRVKTFVDLSFATRDTPSEATPVTVDLLDHVTGATVLGLTPEDFPDGMAISNETVTLTTHTGTHMDAPLHYGPFSGGKPAKSIDEVPLEWCYGPGVRLDVRHVPPGEGITVEHLIAALDEAGHTLAPGDIVLLWTGADALWGSAEYLSRFPGLTGEGTAFLAESGVRVIGIDAWGLDRPMGAMIEEYRRTGDQGCLWPAHVYGRTQEYLQLEKLTDLGRLPGPTGFDVSCFPVAVAGAGAGWTRVVAVIEDPEGSTTP